MRAYRNIEWSLIPKLLALKFPMAFFGFKVHSSEILYYPFSLALKKLSLKASLWPEHKNPCEWKALFFFHSLLLLSYSQRLAYKDSF